MYLLNIYVKRTFMNALFIALNTRVSSGISEPNCSSINICSKNTHFFCVDIHLSIILQDNKTLFSISCIVEMNGPINL